ncbi:lipopolysaccharide transport periplasmic protein LptA [Legionella worsleiensis]|uniref:Lipopolysaccharide export system protein LptA n=1 Tax=Legionella worsleiensis TaxID=45076 RepID=A0A0W1A3U3_9GAMM|nr:lipopolysaccharide transport periplasmic protein LptA [Legionella worsleiensis]KTD75962.1 lipopolysaccharide export system protein LptA [Legionella worsleiensis]STY32975.1 lipopolysaccharide export system protein LptA [Legionella worsleiensis]
MSQLKGNFYLLVTLMLIVTAGYALPSDKEQTMHVVSDSADLSQKNHKGVYIGNVEFIQGTTKLNAAKAITQGDAKNQLILAVANGENGKQAHYWTETGPNKPPFHAYADTIKYYPLKHLIELIGNARIEQGDNSLTAAKISYDTQEQHVVSESDGKTRTTIIIYPEKKPT